MFCIARVGAQIYDTALISPVDRHSTDVTFNDVLLFRQPAVLITTIRIVECSGYLRIRADRNSLTDPDRHLGTAASISTKYKAKPYFFTEI